MTECACCFEELQEHERVSCPHSNCDQIICLPCQLNYKEYQGKEGCMFCNPFEEVTDEVEEHSSELGLAGRFCIFTAVFMVLMFVGSFIYKIYYMFWCMVVKSRSDCDPEFDNLLTYMYEFIFGYAITLILCLLCTLCDSSQSQRQSINL